MSNTRPRLAVVMDPIAAIHYAKDSTLAMLLAAQARGFELLYLEQSDLSLRDGRALGRVRPLAVRADPGDWFTLGEPRTEPLAS
ncbi:MAG TPA: glutathione synthase, partial [Steroidobacteraceae bacterium]|nr:glutathione synthase [Steroidobacteraceae bacterium]